MIPWYQACGRFVPLACGLAFAMPVENSIAQAESAAPVHASRAPATQPQTVAGTPAASGTTDGDRLLPPEQNEQRLPPATAPLPERKTDELQGLLKLGAAMTERGDYASAEIAFRQVMNAPGVPLPELKTALLGLAHMHRRQGALTKTVAILERFLKDYGGDAQSPSVLLELGRTLRGLGLHRLAINRFYSVLNSTLKLTGTGFEHYQRIAKTAQFEIAQTHFEAGSFAEANKHFTRLRLLDLAPADQARAHFMAAYSLRLQGEHEAAITTLNAFIAQSPDNDNVPEARHLLATTLSEIGRTQEALAATFELLRGEHARTATDSRRWAYWQRRTGNRLANEFFEAGDIHNAHAIYRGLAALSNEPEWQLPLTYQIALCHERLGLTEQARGSYQHIVEAAGATPPPGLAEIARMANWRLEHLEWRARLGQQTGAFFSLSTDLPATAPAAAPVPTPAVP